MDAAVEARFVELVMGPDDLLGERLDEAALLVAAAGQGRDLSWLAAQQDRLGALAATCPSGLDGLLSFLFTTEDGGLGLRGDVEGYAEPANSYLDQVLDRRRGIPITLSVLAMAVGRRTGVPLVGVGMPGHFLVRHQGQPRVLLDCFEGGRRLTSGDCEAILQRITGAQPGFDLAWLDPTPPRDIVVRILTNLRQRALATADVSLLSWVAPLRAACPASATTTSASWPASERSSPDGGCARRSGQPRQIRSTPRSVIGDGSRPPPTVSSQGSGPCHLGQGGADA